MACVDNSRPERQSQNAKAPGPILRSDATLLRIPVLMYHGIALNQRDLESDVLRGCVSVETFERQMTFLVEHGYQVTSFANLASTVQNRETFQKKTVVLTFDDGLRSFHTHGLPILARHRLTATVFLPTRFVSEVRASFQGQECMTWAEVEEARRHGVQIGSHTATHPKLIRMAWCDIRRELEESKHILEQRLSAPVRSFAYPYAFPQAHECFVLRFQRLLVDLGYTCCATTEIGRVRLGDNPYRLKRLRMQERNRMMPLGARLQGYFDWLSLPQRLAKRIRVVMRGATDSMCLTR